ncbi:MAG: DUF1109 family protein [Polyangiaceae bacterium]|nr:DUF1109 family protein [Polyangiaceae bacterium]
MMPPEPNELFNDIPDPLGGPATSPVVPNQEERSLTRTNRKRRQAIAAAFTGVWLVGFSLVLGLRSDANKPVIAGQLAVWTVTAAGALWVGMVAKAEGFPISKRGILVALSATALLFWGLSLLHSPGVEANLTIPSIVGCAVTGLIVAIPPSIAFSLVLRRGFLMNPTLRGALVGMVCGLLGAVGVHSHCPVVTPSHVAVAHGVVLVLGAIGGAALGRFFGKA